MRELQPAGRPAGAWTLRKGGPLALLAALAPGHFFSYPEFVGLMGSLSKSASRYFNIAMVQPRPCWPCSHASNELKAGITENNSIELDSGGLLAQPRQCPAAV
jgi:hypothetical protein